MNTIRAKQKTETITQLQNSSEYKLGRTIISCY